MKDALKDFLYRRISDLGSSLTPRAYASGLELASHLRDLFTRLQVTCVLDVGANEGQYRNFLRRRCGYTGTILSFEPAREAFTVLQTRAAGDPLWQVFNFALGADHGEKVLNTMLDTRFSSFLDPQASGWNYLDARNVVNHRETVLVRRLDGFMKDINSDHDINRVYLKMDTQGHDLEVMKGLGNQIEYIVALQSEIPVKQIYKGMTPMCESIETLARHGFDLTGLFPVSRDELFRVTEFDCVAVNTRHALRWLGRNEVTS